MPWGKRLRIFFPLNSQSMIKYMCDLIITVSSITILGMISIIGIVSTIRITCSSSRVLTGVLHVL